MRECAGRNGFECRRIANKRKGEILVELASKKQAKSRVFEKFKLFFIKYFQYPKIKRANAVKQSLKNAKKILKNLKQYNFLNLHQNCLLKNFLKMCKTFRTMIKSNCFLSYPVTLSHKNHRVSMDLFLLYQNLKKQCFLNCSKMSKCMTIRSAIHSMRVAIQRLNRLAARRRKSKGVQLQLDRALRNSQERKSQNIYNTTNRILLAERKFVNFFCSINQNCQRLFFFFLQQNCLHIFSKNTNISLLYVGTTLLNKMLSKTPGKITTLPFLVILCICILAAEPSIYHNKISSLNLFCTNELDLPVSVIDKRGTVYKPSDMIDWWSLFLSRSRLIRRDCVGFSNPPTDTAVDVDSNANCILLTYQNVDGCRQQPSKIDALEAMTASDTISVFSETNVRIEDCALFTNAGIGQKVAMVAQDRITYKNGKRVVLSGSARKKSGFGTVVAVKNHDEFSFSRSFTDFEIIASTVKRFGLKILVLSGYRSPSMRQQEEIDSFYDEISRMIEVEKRKNIFDAVIFVADDNSSPDARGSPSSKAWNKLNEVMRYHGMKNSLVGKKTRKNRCPDSCFTWYNTHTCTISNAIVMKSWVSSDHKSISLRITPGGFNFARKTNPKFKFQYFNKKIMGNKRATSLLSKTLEKFNKKFGDLLKNDSIVIHSGITDNAVYEFLRIVKSIKSKMHQRIVKKVPAEVFAKNSPTKNKLETIKVKMHKLLLAFDRYAGNEPARNDITQKLASLDSQIDELLTKLVSERLKKDMEFQDKISNTNASRAWKNLALLCHKEKGFGDKSAPDRTPEEEEEAVRKLEETFTNTDPDYDPMLDEWKKITPEKSFILPTNKFIVEDIIKNTKKIDSFYKNNAKTLAPSISIILECMQRTQHFPKACRYSRMVFLPSRSIFMLDALPKILESAMKFAFDPLIKSEYSKNDSLNMAYRENCGVELCVSTALAEIEKCSESSVQVFADEVKAFQYCKRGTVLCEFQRICGAGQIVASWFARRWYIFRGWCRGWQFNRGVPAGTIVGVYGYILQKNTNQAMNGNNPRILGKAVSSFSDDSSPSFSITEVRKGGAQDTIDESFRHVCEQGCKYHMDGKKGPTMLVYLRKNQEYASEIDDLNLGGAAIRRVSTQRFLGVDVSVRPIEEPVLAVEEVSLNESLEFGFEDKNICMSLVNKFGYSIHWPVQKLKGLAYRLQNCHEKYSPVDLRKMCMSYVAGTIRFACSQKWLRSSGPEREATNFYYCMSLASICGLNVCEIVGLSACKAEKLSCNSSELAKLLEVTGMPTIEDMAINSARVVVKQAKILFPEKFVMEKSLRRRRKQYDLFLPCSTVPEYRSTLWGELCKLALRQREREEKPVQCKPTDEQLMKIRNGELSAEDVPWKNSPIPKKQEFLSRIWDFCKTEQKESTMPEIKLLFASFCRLHFDVLDPQDRRRSWKTPSNKLIYSCKLLVPFGGRNDACVLCGDDFEAFADSKSCTVCSREIHVDCAEILYKFGCKKNWREVGVPGDFMCEHIDFNIRLSDKVELLNTSQKEGIEYLLYKPEYLSRVRKFSNAFRKCEFCSEEISLDTKNHTLSCRGIGTPILTPSAKRVRLTALNPGASKDSVKLKRLSRFLGKFVEKTTDSNLEKMKQRRERCEVTNGTGKSGDRLTKSSKT